MDKASIFSKTAKGISALSDRKFALSREQHRLLGMVDGHSTSAELSEKSGYAQELAEQIFSHLLVEGMVKLLSAPSELNGETMISVTELDPEEGVRAWAEAQRVARGLHDEGFFAHKIRPMQERGGRPAILSVEDDPIIGSLLIVLLGREGFDVRHVSDGKSMYSALEEAVPDLVMLDVMLPDTSGFELLEWIRKQPKLANLPVIMLTAKVGEEDVMHGLRAGADGYIFKPFRPGPLLQCIRSVLKIKRREHAGPT